MAVRSYLTRAAQAYQSLTTTQALAWKNYASTITKRNPVSGKTYNPTAMNAFTELASKFLQITPAGTIPLTPPATPFYGDSIAITATAATGKVTFTATAANAANVKTEFLLQPLKNANRKPSAKGYRTKGFFAYVAGTLTYDVVVPSGYYAAAYRFVNSQTGQQSEPVYLAVQQVTFSVSSGTKGAKSDTAKAA